MNHNHLDTPEVSKIVRHWANYVGRKTNLFYGDIIQDMWVSAMEAYQEWDEDKNASFTSYLFIRLRGRASNDIKKACKRTKLHQQYLAHNHNDENETWQDPTTDTVETVTQRLLDRLSETPKTTFDTARVLRVLVDPPEELQQMTWDHERRERRPLANQHVAHYLGLSSMSVTRALRRIESMLERMLEEKSGKIRASC